MNEQFCVARHQHNGVIEGHWPPHSSVSGHRKVTLPTLSRPLCLSPTLYFLLVSVFETCFLQAIIFLFAFGVPNFSHPLIQFIYI